MDNTNAELSTTTLDTSGDSDTTLFMTVEDGTVSQMLLLFSLGLGFALIAKCVAYIAKICLAKSERRRQKREPAHATLEPPAWKIPVARHIREPAPGGLFDIVLLTTAPGSPAAGKRMWDDNVSVEDSTIFENPANYGSDDKAPIMVLPSKPSDSRREDVNKNTEPSVIHVKPRRKQKDNLTFENDAIIENDAAKHHIWTK